MAEDIQKQMSLSESDETFPVDMVARPGGIQRNTAVNYVFVKKETKIDGSNIENLGASHSNPSGSRPSVEDSNYNQRTIGDEDPEVFSSISSHDSSESGDSEVENEEIAEKISLSDKIVMFPNRKLSNHRKVVCGEICSELGNRPCVIKYDPVQVINEIEALQKLGCHTNIVYLNGCGKFQDAILEYSYLVIEKYHDQNLEDYVRSESIDSLYDINRGLEFCKQIIEGMKYVHEKLIIHKDLKPSNIFLSHDLKNVKIGDFGSSIEVKSTLSMVPCRTMFGTLGYCPPESLNTSNVSLKSDIYSLAVVFYFMLSKGKSPFGSDSALWDYNIKEGIIDLSSLLVSNPIATEHLLQTMLRTERRCRPSIQNVELHHSWTGKEFHAESVPDYDYEEETSDCDETEVAQAARREDKKYEDDHTSRQTIEYIKRMSRLDYDYEEETSDCDETEVAQAAQREDKKYVDDHTSRQTIEYIKGMSRLDEVSMSDPQRRARPRRLEDEFYRVMSQFDNRSWLQFARSVNGLRLQTFQVDDIRSYYASDREQKYQMLSLWRRRNGFRATPDLLDRIVSRYRDSEQTRMQAHVTAANTTTAQDDAEVLQDFPHHEPRRTTVTGMVLVPREQPARQESIHSEYIHRDNERVFNDGPVTNQPASTTSPQSSYVMADTMPELEAAAHVRRIGNVDSSFEASIQCADSGNPNKLSSETIPKEVLESNFRREQKVTSATVGLPKTFHSHCQSDPNTNENINVYGSSAIGIQTNYYGGTDDHKLSRVNAPSEDPVQSEQICSQVLYDKVIPSKQSFYESHLEQIARIYKICHTPKGAILIINYSFTGEKDQRHGSEKDVEYVKKMWESIGCKTFMRSDLSADETILTLSKFASSPTAYNSDFVAVMIMSHGALKIGEGVFYSADRKPVLISQVLEIFNNGNARRLQGIPKLFFLQICLGNAIDKGVEMESPVERCEQLSELFNSMEISVKKSSGSPNDDDATDAQGTAIERLPTMSDCMISCATLAGYRAFRNNANGSWYINAIVNIFSRHAHHHHVMDLMTMVNSYVSKADVSIENEYIHVKIYFQSTLTKILYLFPGFPIVTGTDDF